MTTTKVTTPAILERLAKGEFLITDGATGTYLQMHGLEPGGCPEAFNLTHPEIVRQMAADYFAAGSDFVLTNSFGGNKFMLKKYGHGDKVREIDRAAAQLARAAAPAGRFVVGSVGPTGEFLEPLGSVSEREMYDAFATQIGALEDGGADAVDIETMTSIEEATLAVRAAKENTDLAVFATMVFDKGPRGLFTMMGVTPERAVRELTAAGADVVGTNCGNGIEVMIEIARRLKAATTGYVMVKSNAGIPSIIQGKIVYPETPDWMAERFKTLVDLGINAVGGCCGTGPGHIVALCKAVGRSR
ncbi:MAG: homocysteine S-methyltransferase family protein [Chloroflexi bacterium]|nr:homocysteine S-methyltransferase family protein [Chloroflexota bacterium]